MTDKKSASVETWAVVCQGLDVVVGPFFEKKDAIKAAQLLTQKAKESALDCVYLPVPFLFMGKLIVGKEAIARAFGDPPEKAVEYSPRGYL